MRVTHKNSPGCSTKAHLSAKRRLYTSTSVAKRHRIVVSDSPISDASDPEYILGENSDINESSIGT